jgi:chromate transporter
VTAAVVGVIANLAVYFAVHTLFSRTTPLSAGPIRLDVPVWSSYVGEAFVITAVAMVLVFGLKWSVLRTLGACALLGLVLSYVG